MGVEKVSKGRRISFRKGGRPYMRRGSRRTERGNRCRTDVAYRDERA